MGICARKLPDFVQKVHRVPESPRFLDVFRIEIERGRKSEEKGRNRTRVLKRDELVIVAIDNNMGAGLCLFKHFRFCTENSVPILQVLQMAETDISKDADGRLRHAGKARHFSKIADAHFKNGRLMFFPYAEDREGKPYFIVKVSFCLQDAEALRQNGCNHFLSACLSYASRDSYDRNRECAAVIFCDLFDCFQSGIHQNIGTGRMLRGFLAEYAGSAFGIDGGDEAVSVHAGAPDGCKKEAGFDLTAVDYDALYFSR